MKRLLSSFRYLLYIARQERRFQKEREPLLSQRQGNLDTFFRRNARLMVKYVLLSTVVGTDLFHSFEVGTDLNYCSLLF